MRKDWPQITVNPDGSRTWRLNGLSIYVSSIELTPTEEYNGRRRKYKLLRNFTFSVRTDSGSYVMTMRAKAGWTTDFASQPAFAGILLGPRDGDALVPSLVHDLACEENFPGFMANSIFTNAMIVAGVPKWKRVVYFLTLEILGYGSLPFRAFSALLRLLKRG